MITKEELKQIFQKRYTDIDFTEQVLRPVFGDRFHDVEIEDMLESYPDIVDTAMEHGIVNWQRIGEVKTLPGKIDIFDITVTSKVQMHRNRISIQSTIHKVMRTVSSAFMIFHYETGANWDWRFTFYRKQGAENSDPKRYTFLLGPDQSCRTAAENFMELANHKGTLKVDDIQKAFDVEALSKEFFTKYKNHYEKFCQFVYDNKTDEEWFGSEFTEWEDKTIRDYVKKLLGRIVFLHFLQKKGWMGVPKGKKWGEGDQRFMKNLFCNATPEQKANYLDLVLEPLFKDMDKMLCGGLFERDAFDEPDSRFPAEYFEELLKFFGEYNFTIDENDPNDAEVGIDPEMLGRIFENLLEDNKDKGAFYTPKEIVQYMCRESLIAYLQTDIEDDAVKQSFRDFVTTHEVSTLNPADVYKVDKKLREVKICDPAIGSGAFPMGLLKELFDCRMAIEDKEKTKSPAEIKKDIIQNSIYGVDIEKGAVDIARLRFWLSLVLDEETPHALPNLDYKIMLGNSLLENYKGVDLSNLMQSDDMFVQIMAEEVEKDIKLYFKAENNSEKIKLREKIDFGVKQCLHSAGFQESIEIPNTDFFLWHTYFRDVFDKGGFDIVIGNPPYIQLQSMSEMSAVYKEAKFETYNKTGDIYCLFVEQGFKLLNKNGILTYIMPNKWMQTGYGQQLREYLAKKRILNIVDFGDVQLFENATTYTCIPLLQQAKPYDTFTASYMKSADISAIPDYSRTFETKDFGKDAWVLSSSGELKLVNKLKKKHPTLKTYSKGEAYRGVLSGLSEAFLVGTDVYNGLVKNNSNVKQKMVPFLLGRDIKPYASPTPNKYMILFEKGFTKHQYGESLSENVAWDHLKEDYSSIANWLEPFTEKGRKRGDKGDYWWELRACDYYDEFAKPKIMYQAFQVKPNFIYDETGCYCNNSMWILPTDNKALLGLLNSKMGWWLISKFCSQIQNGYQLIWKYFGQIPIALDEKKQQPIITLVDRILSAKKSNPLADTTAEEREIDRLVYDLYGLTEEEIAIVERTK